MTRKESTLCTKVISQHRSLREEPNINWFVTWKIMRNTKIRFFNNRFLSRIIMNTPLCFFISQWIFAVGWSSTTLQSFCSESFLWQGTMQYLGSERKFLTIFEFCLIGNKIHLACGVRLAFWIALYSVKDRWGVLDDCCHFVNAMADGWAVAASMQWMERTSDFLLRVAWWLFGKSTIQLIACGLQRIALFGRLLCPASAQATWITSDELDKSTQPGVETSASSIWAIHFNPEKKRGRGAAGS